MLCGKLQNTFFIRRILVKEPRLCYYTVVLLKTQRKLFFSGFIQESRQNHIKNSMNKSNFSHASCFAAKVLDIQPGITAIIGGGGKTTLMERLAAELSREARVIVCTTTHILPEKTMPCLVSPTQTEIAAALVQSPCICVGAWAKNGKFGPPELPVGALARLADFVIVEADGAKRLPLKAHAAHEPVVPPEANQTILVVGASGFGKPMEQSVHRAALAAERLGVSPETVVTPELWVKFLNAEALHTRVLVNQAETEQAQADARALAAGLRAPVCMAALQKGWIECLC